MNQTKENINKSLCSSQEEPKQEQEILKNDLIRQINTFMQNINDLNYIRSIFAFTKVLSE